MKKFITSAVLGIAFALSAQAAIMTLNTTTNNVYLLSTNGVDVQSIAVSSAYSASVELFDLDTLAAPYYGTNKVTSAYATRTSFPTNYVTSYVGFTGYTNWYTNAGRWTLVTTNAAATNSLVPLSAFAIGANQVANSDDPVTFAKGITVRANTNTTIVIYYTPR